MARCSDAPSFAFAFECMFCTVYMFTPPKCMMQRRRRGLGQPQRHADHREERHRKEAGRSRCQARRQLQAGGAQGKGAPQYTSSVDHSCYPSTPSRLRPHPSTFPCPACCDLNRGGALLYPAYSQVLSSRSGGVSPVPTLEAQMREAATATLTAAALCN